MLTVITTTVASFGIEEKANVCADRRHFKKLRFTHQDISCSKQTTKRRTGISRTGMGHWVIDASATVRQCFSHLDEKQLDEGMKACITVHLLSTQEREVLE